MVNETAFPSQRSLATVSYLYKKISPIHPAGLITMAFTPNTISSPHFSHHPQLQNRSLHQCKSMMQNAISKNLVHSIQAHAHKQRCNSCTTSQPRQYFHSRSLTHPRLTVVLYSFAFSGPKLGNSISLTSPAASFKKWLIRSQPRCFETMLNCILTTR